MSFTKVTSAGIGSTELVTLDSLEVINNLTVGGVLTYEDVTNVDSIGIITARAGVLVGSGITLSKDGDVFFTGIATGNGSGLTALNASNIGSGTVPTARLGSGTASSSTFLRGDSTFQTVNTDLVSDTSPQLGGNLDVNTKNIVFGDSGSASDDRLVFGADTDFMIYHNATSNIINNTTKELHVNSSSAFLAKFIPSGAVELYHNGTKRFETDSNGVKVTAPEGARAELRIFGDEADDNNDYFKLSGGDGTLKFQDASNGSSWEDNIVINAAGSVELYHDNSKKFETTSNGATVTGTLSAGAADLGTGDLTLTGNINLADSSGGGNNRIIFGAGDDLQIWHDGSDSHIADEGTGALKVLSNLFRVNNAANNEAMIKAEENGAVELYYDGSVQFYTSDDGLRVHNDKKITRNGNSNTTLIEVTNSSYAKSLYIGGWTEDNTSGISRIRCSNDNLHIDSGSIGSIYLNAYSSGEIRARHTRPMSDNTYDLGSSSLRWDDVYATNGTIHTSDRNKKNTIVDSDLGLSFVNKLKPVSYKFNDATRTHYGLIAQDVETVLSDISKPTTDFAGFIKTDLPDEYYQEAEPNIPEDKKEGDLKSAAHTEYGLRYGEFISPLIKAVQELSAENTALKARLDAAGL